jgi:hypothetical protein
VPPRDHPGHVADSAGLGGAPAVVRACPAASGEPLRQGPLEMMQLACFYLEMMQLACFYSACQCAASSFRVAWIRPWDVSWRRPWVCNSRRVASGSLAVGPVPWTTVVRVGRAAALRSDMRMCCGLVMK